METICPEAVDLAAKFDPAIACNFEISQWLQGKGVASPVIGMNKGGTTEIEGLRVTMVDARHSSSITEADGTIVYAGELPDISWNLRTATGSTMRGTPVFSGI